MISPGSDVMNPYHCQYVDTLHNVIIDILVIM